MAKKTISWKTKGMNRDTSVSAFNPEFAFENINMRLSTNEGNTMMSWVNERGTKSMVVNIDICPWAVSSYSNYINGITIGTAVINHKLVLFTVYGELNLIYLLWKSDKDNTDIEGKLLFSGELNMDIEHPLETLVSYESENIQKVYWTDGINQPRIINIAAENSTIGKWQSIPTPFDFIPELALNEDVRVTKIFGSGEFPAGVIQYAFTYYNKYGQESNIFYTTPLQYIAYIDRGGAPDSKIANAFKIGINNVDHNFDYLRIYSILRTSKDATPLCKRVADLPIADVVSDGTSQSAKKAPSFDITKDNLGDFGKTITLSMIAKYSQITTLNNSLYVQGAAAYGKYLFQAYIAGKYIDVIDLETYERIATLETDIAYDFNAYHGNVLSFGKDLAEGSSFPYLYYSCESNSAPCILVIKILSTDDTWKGNVVQRIYLPSCSKGGSQLDGNGESNDFSHYYQNGCVDAENGFIWVSGYTMNSYTSNTGDYEENQLVYRKYALPQDTNSKVYLTSSDVQETFILPFKKGTQGMVIKDEKLYQCYGYDQDDIYDEYLDCIDLSTGKIAKSYNFPKDKLKDLGEELESPYIYNGSIFLSATCYKWRYYTLWNISFSENDDSGGVIVPPITDDPSDTDVFELSYIDDGLRGDTVDPTELLYKGGNEIRVETMEQKDGTLFLGNLSISNSPLETLQEKLLGINSVNRIGTSDTNYLANDNVVPSLSYRYFSLISKEPFKYINTLSARSNTDSRDYEGAACFKSREYYRLGVQFQHKNGKWSQPFWIGDKKEEESPVIYSSTADSKLSCMGLPGFKFTLEENNGMQDGILSALYSAGYRRARPMFAVPRMADRTILCQGIGCPTVYRKVDRYSDAKDSGDSVHTWEGKERGRLYAQSSWLFRVKTSFAGTWNNNLTTNADARDGGGKVSYQGKLHSQFEANCITSGVNTSDSYLQCMSPYLRCTEIMGIFDDGHSFYVDDTLATVHTPELIFDDSFASMDFTGCQMNRVGRVPLVSTYGDIDIQTSTPAIGSDAAGFVHKSVVTDGAAALITAPFYNDYLVDDLGNDKYEAYHTSSPAIDYPVYMWQKNGSLNNDVARDNRSANLLKKRISNYRLGGETSFFISKNDGVQSVLSYDVSDIQLFNQDELSVVKVNGEVYMGNIETMMTPTTPSPHYLIGNPWRDEVDTDFESDSYYYLALKDPTDNDSLYGVWSWKKSKRTNWSNEVWDWWYPKGDYQNVGDYVKGLDQWREPISMKYRSTPHLIVKLDCTPGEVISTNGILGKELPNDNMPLVEVTKSYDKDILYGGASDEALRELTWIPCGPVVAFNASTEKIELQYKWGDTYVQRFECLKTYPFTTDDKNQVVEIASFMCESRVNMDGRYDRNRGQTSNLNMTPQNFNLLNPVYSQMDNFFSYRILPEDSYKETSYPNTITWTKTKQNGADVDLWTSITMASTLELDGDKGELTKLTKMNNTLLAFQDKGISQILYNESTQISTTEGVPIEIANSEKVQGKRYLSNTVGCSNKWSIAQTPMGIYFVDSNEKSIYLFNGQLLNISTQGGFNSWAKQSIPSASTEWNPIEFNNFVTYYDKANQDVLFINESTALAYSEKFGCFTSFYDYAGSPFLCTIDDMELWIRDLSDYSNLYQHQAGEYCNFFDENKPFSMTLVANQEPQLDKIFTNLEFRACVEGEGTYNKSTDKFTPSLPFDSLEAWNEYQHGITSLRNRNVKERIPHGSSDSILARKFRTWACDIPRDNVTPNDSEASMGIKRFKARPLDRIRNPWAYIKLRKNAAASGSLSKIEVHDIVASYFA